MCGWLLKGCFLHCDDDLCLLYLISVVVLGVVLAACSCYLTPALGSIRNVPHHN